MRELLTAAVRVGGVTHLVGPVTMVLQGGPRSVQAERAGRGRGGRRSEGLQDKIAQRPGNDPALASKPVSPVVLCNLGNLFKLPRLRKAAFHPLRWPGV